MNIFDLYTDYLQIIPGLATATGLSSILDKAVSHDQVTSMLANHESDSKALWRTVKSLVREHEHIDGCLIFDDTILHKPHTDENEVICWHHDHATGKSVKGINLLTTFYYSQNSEQPLKIPVAFDIIEYIDN